MRILDWLRSWFRISWAIQHADALKRECVAVERAIRRSDSFIEEQSHEIASMVSTFQKKLTTVQQANLQYEETIQKLRSEAKIHELEIKMLTESHMKLMERYRAETAVEVFKQSAAKTRDGG